MATAIAGAFGLGRQGVEYHHIPDPLPVQDTIVYPKDAYKLKRVGDFESVKIAAVAHTPEDIWALPFLV